MLDIDEDSIEEEVKEDEHDSLPHPPDEDDEEGDTLQKRVFDCVEPNKPFSQYCCYFPHIRVSLQKIQYKRYKLPDVFKNLKTKRQFVDLPSQFIPNEIDLMGDDEVLGAMNDGVQKMTKVKGRNKALGDFNHMMGYKRNFKRVARRY